MKKATFVAIAILLSIWLLFSLPTVRVLVQESYNSRIDFSCNIDSDCSIKKIGCNECTGAGPKYSCVNRNSHEGVCFEANSFNSSNCTSIPLIPPASCKCQTGECVGQYFQIS